MSAADDKHLAPTSYRGAVKRLARSAVGKLFHFESHRGVHPHLADVFPIAWGISRLAPDARRICILHDGVPRAGEGRWHSLIPILLGAHKSTKVEALVGPLQGDANGTGHGGPLKVLAAPRLDTRDYDTVITNLERPDVVVFTAIEERDLLLEELCHPQLHAWVAQGTAVLLMARTDSYLAIAMAAIELLDGRCGEIHHRLSAFEFSRSMVVDPEHRSLVSACRMLRAPVAGDALANVSDQLEWHLNLIVESMTDASADGGLVGVIGSSFEVPPMHGSAEFLLALPKHFTYLESESKRGAETRRTGCILSFEMLVARIADQIAGVPEYITRSAAEYPAPTVISPEIQPLRALADNRSASGIRARYRFAITLYQRIVRNPIDTVFGSYRLDHEGYLTSVDRDVHEAADERSGRDPSVTAAAALLADRFMPQEATPLAAAPQSGAAAADARVEIAATPAIGEPTQSAAQTVEPRGAGSDEPLPRDAAEVLPVAKAGEAAELHRLREQLADLSARLEAAEAAKHDALRELETARAQLAALPPAPARPRSVAALPVPETAAVVNAILPSTWNELFDWAHRRYPDEIVFTSRARRAARKSAYRDIPMAAHAIELLCENYRRLKIEGGDQARAEFEERCKSLGVQVGPTGMAPVNHRTADLYQASLDGRRYSLDLHLQGSSSRDPTKGLRIYFAWIAERRVLLCGHLPTHLRSVLS